MSSSPPNGGPGKQPPRSTNPRSGQNAFPQPLQVVRRSPTTAGGSSSSTNNSAGAAPPSQDAPGGTQYSNNFNRSADAKFSTGRRETAASSRYGGFDPADYGGPPSPPAVPPLNPGVNRQRSRREQDEQEWEREQRRKNSRGTDDDFDEEVPRTDIPRSGGARARAAPQQERGRPGGPERTRSGATGSYANRNSNSNNGGGSSNNADEERDRQRERIHINIDGNGTSWTSWGNDGQQRSGQFSFSGMAFGGGPFGGGGGRNNARMGPVNLPVNLPINIPGFGGFGF